MVLVGDCCLGWVCCFDDNCKGRGNLFLAFENTDNALIGGWWMR